MLTKLSKTVATKYGEHFYVVARVLVGLMFFAHGAQKLFGWGSDKGAMPVLSFIGFAGLIELVTGLCIAVGVLTRLMAFLAAGTMSVAYIMAHASQGPWWNPLANKGEMALLYFAIFCVIYVKGAGKYGLETRLKKGELF